jgi:hypothetical protein
MISAYHCARTAERSLAVRARQAGQARLAADGLAGFGGAQARHGGDDRTGRRVGHLNVGNAGDPLPADETPAGQQGRVFEFKHMNNG